MCTEVQNVFSYDAFKNQLSKTVSDASGIRLKLAPYEMAVLVIPAKENVDKYEAVVQKQGVAGNIVTELSGPWLVSFTENEDYPNFKNKVSMETLNNILDIQPDFSGVICYENEFQLEENQPLILVFEDAYEAVEVWCNEKYAGECICPPFKFDLAGLTNAGENKLRIEVRTTLERKVHTITGSMGVFGPENNVIKPEGLIGKAILYNAEEI